MEKKINAILLQHIGKQDLIDELQSKFLKKKSQLLEVIGGSGSGKTHLLKKLCERIEKAEIEYGLYSPVTFTFNQFEDVFHILSGLDKDASGELLKQAASLLTNSKYDYFYYITEQLKERGALTKKIVIFDNCNILDRYTLDFIQFFIEDISDYPLQIIAFTKDELFPFSIKYPLPFLTKEDIQKILSELYPQIKKDLETQAEILYTLSNGDIYLIEHILNDLKKNKNGFDLATYLEDQVSVKSICIDKITTLTKEQHLILLLIYLLDGKANNTVLKEFLIRKKKNINEESIVSTLVKLEEKTLIEEIFGSYHIRKRMCFDEYFLSLPKEDRTLLYQEINDFLEEYMLKESLVSETALLSYRIKIYKFDREAGLPSEQSFNTIADYLFSIRDYDNLIAIYSLILPVLKKVNGKLDTGTTTVEGKLHTTKKITPSELEQIKSIVKHHSKIGIVYKNLNRYEEAIDNLREALRIAVQYGFPIDETVYELADNLHKLNSLAFAFEVIKKYQSSVKTPYWMCKLILLKADIQIDMNNDDEARKYVDEIYELYLNIDDENKRQIIFAEAKKLLGKIYYYTNQWDKAEAAFKEAGKIFSSLSRLEGQAAIYNNLGVLKMYRGEWEETEALYKKSLDIEKKLYSLDGISICYNNLGGLWADRGDYKQSLKYLNEALKIQKLLNDRYNICNIYNNIGVTYMDNAEFDKAEESFKNTLEVAKNFNLFKNLVAALNNLGALYFKSGHWSKAINCYEEAIDRSEKNKFIDGLCKSYNNLGELHEKRGDYELAYDLYFKASKIIPQLNDEFQKAEIWGNMGSVLTHLHKYIEAYGYLVESLDFFKALNAQDKIIEGCHKMAYYFIATRNYESGTYYLDFAQGKAEDINNSFELGKTFYLKGLLEKKDVKTARSFFEKAIKTFVETKNYYELALANYEFANILFESSEWEQALEILKNNKKILKDYGALALIEKNDVLLQKIERDYAKELKETKEQEFLLTKFYETTQNLKSISSFDTLLEYTLDSFVDLAEADGGIMCIYNSQSNPDSWEYKLFNKMSPEDKDYDTMMGIIQKTFQEGKFLNFKQPAFASQYNNIASFPLTFHNQNLGVILLFSRYGSNYFSDKVCNLLNALCNQTVVIIENFRHNILSRSHAIIREELSSPQLFTNIIGKSDKMQAIFKVIDKVKDTPTTVLLEGQSGTGKELIARAIHYSSIRRNKKFIAQYCGSLPETLLESELFGHVKGSFTGATYDKKGLFEVADGGSFFLDEIADISMSTQAKLLRFLQEGEVKRVGSTKTQMIDVRVICATNVSLKDKIEKGEFRLDLYYRLNVIKIEVPKLSDRKSDIPLLTIHFLDKYNKKMGKNVKGITDETLKIFENYEWPGNIRQLENEIERAVTLVENDDYIKPSDLSEEIFRYSSLPQDYSFDDQTTLKDAVQVVERNMILESLKRNTWNQSQTAKELGLSRQGLIKKIKRYNLDKL